MVNHSVGWASPTEIWIKTFITNEDDVVTHVGNLLKLPISYEMWKECHRKWNDGALIQDAFPMLTQNQREYIMTGNAFDGFFGEADA